MRKTIISILGHIKAEDFMSLRRSAEVNGYRLNMTGLHIEIRMSGPNHDPDMLLSNTPMAGDLRWLLGRARCAISSETDPGNGRPITGVVLCMMLGTNRDASNIATLPYQVDQNTGSYSGISAWAAARIEDLREASTLIDGHPLQDWLTRALANIVELPLNRLPRSNREVVVPPAGPLLLAPEMRTDRMIEDEVRNAFAM